MLPEQAEVVVVGAGPTGLTLACTLRKAGVEVLVLDKFAEGAKTSRAIVLHARTLEVLGELDMSRRLIQEGRSVPVFSIRAGNKRLMSIDFSGLPTAYPYVLMLPQSRTEAILNQRLAELGGQVQRPYTATAVRTCNGGATVSVAGPDAQPHTVQARYVVGADGMHSTVREAAGISFTGGRYDQSFVLADVSMQWPLSAQEAQLFLNPAGLMVVVPLPDGDHRIVATMEHAPERITKMDVQTLIDQRGPGEAQVHDMVWSSRFWVHHRVADTYRRGPLLLAGDAAHVHSPAGGQGMNIGIQDALVLGQILDQVLKGATDAALDAYQERRRPVAQQVVAFTDRATRITNLTRPRACAARNTLFSLVGRIPPAQHKIAFQLAELSDRPT